ncbi:hypothetical protein N9R81_04230 [Flavobacteriales bacterium]|nr:hypothetical protein [Flavobacteriales bacterium]
MKIITSLFLTLITINSFAQKEERDNGAGQIEFGTRTSISLFDDHLFPGIGYGGQFRIRVNNRINTEWYGDYIKTDIGGLGTRQTAHIGWSVTFSPIEKSLTKNSFIPYFIAGHCFDYASVSSNLYGDGLRNQQQRLTTAVQMGIGATYYLGDRVNLALSTQYMYHIGKDLHVEVVKTGHPTDEHPDYGEDYLIIEDGHGAVLEGHLLTTLSLNVLLFDFVK